MATDVDICNLALSRLGDDATVTSIDPAEGSFQADRCATFYPLARDEMLETHPWAFALRRVEGTTIVMPDEITTWQFGYQWPTSAMQVFAVIPPNALDNNASPAATVFSSDGRLSTVLPSPSTYSSQPFDVEILSDGSKVVLTNQEDAVLRYVQNITDTSKFSNLFIDALAWLLASKLAGPIYKGETGANMAAVCYKHYMIALGKAQVHDVNQSHEDINHMPNWMNNR